MSTSAATSTSERAAARALPGLERAHVAVLAGGRSTEREVSLVSGAEILAALGAASDAEDARGPQRVSEVEVLEDGRWRVGGSALAPAAALEALAAVDLFFLALHGGEGEDGTVQGLLQLAGRAYTGAGVGSSAVAMDKVFARHLAAAAGLAVAPACQVTRAEWDADRAGTCARIRRGARGETDGGWVAKPRFGGSSVGTALARAPEELEGALEIALACEEEALVEALVPGVEATCGVLADPGGELLVLPPIEIRPHPGRFFDYEEKYSQGGATELCPPVSLSERVCERLRDDALRAHRFLRCQGYSRSDFIVPAGSDEPVFLELNTLPGLTPRSLLPLAARAAGIDYRTLCLWICHEGLRRARRA